MLVCLPEGKLEVADPALDGTPVGTGYSGEPHVLVSADTSQKSSFVNSLGAKWKPLRGITNHEHRESNFSSL